MEPLLPGYFQQSERNHEAYDRYFPAFDDPDIDCQLIWYECTQWIGRQPLWTVCHRYYIGCFFYIELLDVQEKKLALTKC